MPVRPAAALLALALLTGCSAGTDGDDPTVTAPTSAAPATTGAPSAAPSPTPAVRTIAVAYAGGQVTGTSGREAVELGERVLLRITSDVAEEVHVHGYDALAQVAAGATVEIPLTATKPGGFEVELEDSGKLLFQLRVS